MLLNITNEGFMFHAIACSTQKVICENLDRLFMRKPLLRSAQRTGNTAAVLDQLAHSKERSQMRKDDLFSKLAFIPLVFLLAAVIGFIVIGMFMPLVTLIVALT
jgi:type II secretory pathway component PulF